VEDCSKAAALPSVGAEERGLTMQQDRMEGRTATIAFAILVASLLGACTNGPTTPKPAGPEVSDATDCAIYATLLETMRAVPPPGETEPTHFVDSTPLPSSNAIADIDGLRADGAAVFNGDRRIDDLDPQGLAALKIAASSRRGAPYLVRCPWASLVGHVKALPSDWDARLRPSYPQPRPPHFDPFADCPQRGGPRRGQSSFRRPSRGDCDDAVAKGYPHQWLARPIITADHRYAVVYEAGGPWPGSGGQGVILLALREGRWRKLAYLSFSVG
jgi:hypothetical protein